MSEGELNHLSNLCHLFSASSDIIVADVIEFFLVLAINGFSLGVEHGGGCDDTKLFGFCGNDFELYRFEVAADDEEITLLDWSVSVFEVGYEVGFGEVTTDSFDGVSEGQDVYFSKIGYLSGWFDLYYVTESDT